MKSWIFLLLTLSLLLPSCSSSISVASAVGSPSQPAKANTFTTPSPKVSFTTTPLPTLPPTATLIFTVTPTETASPTPSPTWTSIEAFSTVTVPILLYHHISADQPDNRYYVAPEIFRTQMQMLYDLGYTTITSLQLAEVILYGGKLPSRPIVITFDDGDLDVYQNAFPIMQDFNFVASFYIVAGYVDGLGFVSSTQLKELISAGWEIGSHGMNHVDLRLNHDSIRRELVESKTSLQDALGIKIQTFAYPFGLVDDFVLIKAQDYGYKAGLGLGTSIEHGPGSLLYLSRLEVQADMDLDEFIELLPRENTP